MQIDADILRLARDGSRVTRLVYQGNLNFTFIKGYLRNLIGRGFMEQDGRIYLTTEAGLDWLKRYDDLVVFDQFEYSVSIRT